MAAGVGSCWKISDNIYLTGVPERHHGISLQSFLISGRFVLAKVNGLPLDKESEFCFCWNFLPIFFLILSSRCEAKTAK